MPKSTKRSVSSLQLIAAATATVIHEPTAIHSVSFAFCCARTTRPANDVSVALKMAKTLVAERLGVPEKELSVASVSVQRYPLLAEAAPRAIRGRRT